MPRGAIPVGRIRPLVKEIVKELDYHYHPDIHDVVGGGVDHLAELSGVSSKTLHRLTNGSEHKNVSLETLDKILTAADREGLWQLEPEDGGLADVVRGEVIPLAPDRPTKGPFLCACGRERHRRSKRCRTCHQTERKEKRESTKPKCECGKTISWGAKRCRRCHGLAVKPTMEKGVRNLNLGRSTASLDSMGPKEVFTSRQGMSARVASYD